MSELPLIIGLVVFVLIILFNRNKSEKALALLTDAEKGQVLTHFASIRKSSLYLTMGGLLIYIIITVYPVSGNGAFFPSKVLFALVFLNSLLTQYRTRKMLPNLQVDDAYKKQVIQSMNLNFIAIVVLLVGFVIAYYLHMDYQTMSNC